jgi:hypothetical protein
MKHRAADEEKRGNDVDGTAHDDERGREKPNLNE